MGVSTAKARWNGELKSGNGLMSFTGYEGPFTFASRFEDGSETNPEELVGAANAGCFSARGLAAPNPGPGALPRLLEIPTYYEAPA